MSEGERIFNPEEYMPLREVVFNTLRRQILRGELRPGERLMEIALASRLGVSRTPVREAIRKLENEGLVVMLPRRGAHVAEITSQELNDVLEIRNSLEILAIRKAVKRMTPDRLASLRRAEEAFAALVCSGEEADIALLGEADERFHDLIYESTGNRRLVQILNQLREQMYRFRVEYLKDPGIHQTLIREHDEIIAALEERDEARAVKMISLHIDNQRETINRMLAHRDEEGNHG